METAARRDNPTIQLHRSHAPCSGYTIHRDDSHTKPDVRRRYIFHNTRARRARCAASASHPGRWGRGRAMQGLALPV